MKNHLTRRSFLKHSVSVGLSGALWSMLPAQPLLAVEPIQRRGPTRLTLSLAAYSFRDYFNHQDPAKRITMPDFIDYCADHGCDGAEVTSYYFPKEVTPEYLLSLRRQAFLRGITLSGTAVGNDFTVPKGEKRDQQIASVKQWVDYAALMTAPHIRVFAGSARGVSKEEAKTLCISALEECADYAGKKGIFLGLENHGGIVAEAKDMLEIVRAVKSPWVGINLDTGNFHTDDPYSDLAACAPYAVNVQFKADIAARGQKKAGPADFARLVNILRDCRYQGFVALEYESAPDPYQAVPDLLKRMKALFAAA